MLSKLRSFFEGKGRKVLGIIVFGSYVYSPMKAHDIDLVVIVDKLENAREKVELEVEASVELRRTIRKPADIHVFDPETFRENLEPGSFLSGLALGYKILYDRIGLEKTIEELVRKVGETEGYVYVKERKWNLASIAKAKTKHLKTKS